MAKLKDLKVTIGLSKEGMTKLNKDLRTTKANFRRNFGEIQSMVSSAGRSLTASLTLPLAGVGAAAVKSAIDLEKLETSFVSLTGGAEQAAAMMDNLNKFTAQTPFQIEGVAKAARQLIASGTGVDDVNDRLQFLGDIAATSGTRIEDIAAIFSKVNAKGKVELENLNQLAERGIPIFTALAEATGLPASEMGAGAVSLEQFNSVLASFAEQGGFAHGAMDRLSQTAAGKFSTALDNLKQAGAELAESLMPTLKAIIDRVTSAAQAFAGMSSGMKKFTLIVGALAASAGPLMMLVSGFMALGPAIATVGGALGTLLVAVNPLSIAIVAMVATFGILGKALYDKYITRVREAKYDTKQFTESIKELDKEQQILAVNQRIRELQEERAVIDRVKRLSEAQARVGSLGDKFDKQISSFNASGYAAEIERIDAALTTLGETQATLMFGDGVIVSGGGAEAPTDPVDQQGRSFERLAPLAQLATKEVKNHALENRKLAPIMTTVTDEIRNQGNAFLHVSDTVQNATRALFENIKDSSKGFHLYLKAVIEDLLIKIAGLIAAFAILSVLMGGATGVAELTGGKAGLGHFIAGGLGVTGFAEGGLVTGPTLGLIGEGPGTSMSNPEVIAPLDKLQQMMGGGHVVVSGRLDGRDILISSERANFDRNRVRGF